MKVSWIKVELDDFEEGSIAGGVLGFVTGAFITSVILLVVLRV